MKNTKSYQARVQSLTDKNTVIEQDVISIVEHNVDTQWQLLSKNKLTF